MEVAQWKSAARVIPGCIGHTHGFGTEYAAAKALHLGQEFGDKRRNNPEPPRGRSILSDVEQGPGVAKANQLEQSPLKEMFAFAVVMSYQDQLEEEVPALVEALTGVPMSDQHDTLVTVLVMLIAIYGISKAFDVLFPARDPSALNVTREGLISRAAKLTGVAAERIAASIEVLFTGKSQRVLVGASQKVFAPTRNHPEAAINDGRGEILVSKEAAGGLTAEVALCSNFNVTITPRPVK